MVSDDGRTTGAATFSPDPLFEFANSYKTTIPSNGDSADIYYPLIASSNINQIKTPIALFLPGSRVDISQYSQFANIVASYGFTVIVPEHIRYLPDFGFTGLLPETSQISHVIDFMLAENSNPNSPIAGTLDLDKLVLLGHSFGGAVGLTAIDNSCIYPVCEGEFQRPQQLQAAAFFATNTFVGIRKFIPIRNQGIPIALILGSQDGSSVTPETTQTSYDLIQESPKALITIEGANHYGITNINNPPGARPDPNIPTLPQEKSIETIARWSALFLLAHTLGDRGALDYVNNTGDSLDENVTVVIEEDAGK
ncbi:MAG: alpha/beta hydrolase family protein [Nostoc sp. SerVER01]|nr:alpha/beta hydrolase [Nostoc sp. SerVER01]